MNMCLNLTIVLSGPAIATENNNEATAVLKKNAKGQINTL